MGKKAKRENTRTWYDPHPAGRQDRRGLLAAFYPDGLPPEGPLRQLLRFWDLGDPRVNFNVMDARLKRLVKIGAVAIDPVPKRGWKVGGYHFITEPRTAYDPEIKWSYRILKPIRGAAPPPAPPPPPPQRVKPEPKLRKPGGGRRPMFEQGQLAWLRQRYHVAVKAAPRLAKHEAAIPHVKELAKTEFGIEAGRNTLLQTIIRPVLRP